MHVHQKMTLSTRAIKLLVTTTVNQLLILTLIPNLTCAINDSKNFDSAKQIDGENNKVILDSNKRNDSNNNNNNSDKAMMLISLWVTVV